MDGLIFLVETYKTLKILRMHLKKITKFRPILLCKITIDTVSVKML